jgi:hypothetical protein
MVPSSMVASPCPSFAVHRTRSTFSLWTILRQPHDAGLPYCARIPVTSHGLCLRPTLTMALKPNGSTGSASIGFEADLWLDTDKRKAS